MSPTTYLVLLLIAVHRGRIGGPEIARIIGISTSRVYMHLKQLKDEGWIRRKKRGGCYAIPEWEVDYQRLQSWLLSGRRRSSSSSAPPSDGPRLHGKG
ncbi:winged helix-turn-helix domain-containing protein [Thermoflexus sp.]|uniref:winged helix-turn-helix domain-containing protein n=1 Tax=Thermoflexus sp. TaxID=1969742 RepID=UPI003A1030A8